MIKVCRKLHTVCRKLAMREAPVCGRLEGALAPS